MVAPIVVMGFVLSCDGITQSQRVLVFEEIPQQNGTKVRFTFCAIHLGDQSSHGWVKTKGKGKTVCFALFKRRSVLAPQVGLFFRPIAAKPGQPHEVAVVILVEPPPTST